MKKYIVLTACLFAFFLGHSQSNEIAMSLEISSETRGFTPAQIDQLRSRLERAFREADVTVLGGGTEIVIKTDIQLGEAKKVDTGMKKLHSQSISLTLNAQAPYSDLKFNSMQIDLTGSGANRSAAVTQAIQQVKPQQSSIARFIKEAKAEAIRYFDENCEQVLKRTEPMDLEEALGLLSSVPQVSSCFEEANNRAFQTYLALQGRDCEKQMAEAKAKLSANNYEEGLQILTKIDPDAPCFPQTAKLFEEVAEEVDENQRQAWETQRQLIANTKELEAMRLKNFQEWRRMKYRH